MIYSFFRIHDFGVLFVLLKLHECDTAAPVVEHTVLMVEVVSS